ncbi:hypothetical protein [Coxiella-like endosymbiont]|uniref:hypothetical protein n=1 Tax=Coxiella-like endosymbiont TaxID=1592897 RepID=UPI002729F438|nr:hypothetical protein [Coxiella-like endosymbiont]
MLYSEELEGSNDLSTLKLYWLREKPPSAHWPNQVRMAINFIINCEERAELNILNSDPQSEKLTT